MYHYSARQALMEAKQQQLLTAAAKARTLRELRKPRRSWRRASAADAPAGPVGRPSPVEAPVGPPVARPV